MRGRQAARPDLYDPNDDAASQAFAAELRGGGSNGIAYDSVRRQGGQCLAIFRPKLLPAALQGDHWDYRWDGSPDPKVTRLTNNGAK